MKTFLTPLLVIVLGITINAQNLKEKHFARSVENPVLLINNEIIGSTSLLKKIPIENLSISDFSKNDELSTTKLYIAELEKRGILKVEIDTEFDIKTQKDLNAFFGFKETNDIYVNGYLINKEHSISTESIKKIEIIEPDRIILKTLSLNIII